MFCPKHIPLDVIAAQNLSYEWDSWDPYAPLGEHDEDTMDRLSRLSNRAILAYSIGCAEWVVCRLRNHFNNQLPFDFIESCWAFEMERTYLAPRPLNENEWLGQILGAVELSLVTILNTYYTTEDDAAEVEAALGELLALHVLEDKRPFVQWRDKVLDRLFKYYPRVKEDTWGASVPREALNPGILFTMDESNKYVDSFLNSLDLNKNLLLVKKPNWDNTQ
jgi:hypothetical protein